MKQGSFFEYDLAFTRACFWWSNITSHAVSFYLLQWPMSTSHVFNSFVILQESEWESYFIDLWEYLPQCLRHSWSVRQALFSPKVFNYWLCVNASQFLAVTCRLTGSIPCVRPASENWSTWRTCKLPLSRFVRCPNVINHFFTLYSNLRDNNLREIERNTFRGAEDYNSISILYVLSPQQIMQACP